jgi:hypothetical protein
MIRICIQIGNWKFEQGRFYKLKQCQNHSGKSVWWMWEEKPVKLFLLSFFHRRKT